MMHVHCSSCNFIIVFSSKWTRKKGHSWLTTECTPLQFTPSRGRGAATLTTMSWETMLWFLVHQAHQTILEQHRWDEWPHFRHILHCVVGHLSNQGWALRMAPPKEMSICRRHGAVNDAQSSLISMKMVAERPSFLLAGVTKQALWMKVATPHHGWATIQLWSCSAEMADPSGRWVGTSGNFSIAKVPLLMTSPLPPAKRGVRWATAHSWSISDMISPKERMTSWCKVNLASFRGGWKPWKVVLIVGMEGGRPDPWGGAENDLRGLTLSTLLGTSP